MKTAVLAAALACALSTPALAGIERVSLETSVPAATPATAAPATVYAAVSISRQTMDVLVLKGSGEAEIHNWTVSTGRKGHATPPGNYQPIWLDKDHRSKTYDDAPMPFAVFFHGGYAVHATTDTKHLGQPASHGCVRLSKADAAAFYGLVLAYGRGNTQIAITR